MKSFHLVLAAFVCAASGVACASTFGVTPLRIDLGAKAKSGSVTVANGDTKKLAFQVYAKKWTQKPNGENVYEDTTDLVVFPQQLEIAPGQKKLVRVGV